METRPVDYRPDAPMFEAGAWGLTTQESELSTVARELGQFRLPNVQPVTTGMHHFRPRTIGICTRLDCLGYVYLKAMVGMGHRCDAMPWRQRRLGATVEPLR